MNDYNDGKWHGWNGGECPVDPDTLVETIWMQHNGCVRDDARPGQAKGFIWAGNEHGAIIAFRVVKPAPPKPREAWAVGHAMQGSREEAETFLAQLRAYHGDLFADTRVTRWVEVIE